MQVQVLASVIKVNQWTALPVVTISAIEKLKEDLKASYPGIHIPTQTFTDGFDRFYLECFLEGEVFPMLVNRT